MSCDIWRVIYARPIFQFFSQPSTFQTSFLRAQSSFIFHSLIREYVKHKHESNTVNASKSTLNIIAAHQPISKSIKTDFVTLNTNDRTGAFIQNIKSIHGISK